eukprot:scaffold19825_cov103-Isochrysis_galbana.AAC.6
MRHLPDEYALDADETPLDQISVKTLTACFTATLSMTERMAKRLDVRRRPNGAYRTKYPHPYPRRTLEQILKTHITKAIGSPLGPRGMLWSTQPSIATHKHKRKLIHSPLEGKSRPRLMRT